MYTPVEDAISEIYASAGEEEAEKYHTVEIILTVCNVEEVAQCLANSFLWRTKILHKLGDKSLFLRHDTISEMDSYELLQVYEGFRRNGYSQCQQPIGEYITNFLINQQPSLMKSDVLNVLSNMSFSRNKHSLSMMLVQELARKKIVLHYYIDEEKLCHFLQEPVREVVGNLYEACDKEGKYDISHLFFIYMGLFRKEYTHQSISDTYHGLRCDNYCYNMATMREEGQNFCSNECQEAYSVIAKTI